MMYPFRIALVLFWLVVMLMPVLIELGHHHDDGPVSHEVTCHGDCGCVCHTPTFVLTASNAIPFEAYVSLSIDSYLPARSEADPAAVDHPPELNS